MMTGSILKTNKKSGRAGGRAGGKGWDGCVTRNTQQRRREGDTSKYVYTYLFFFRASFFCPWTKRTHTCTGYRMYARRTLVLEEKKKQVHRKKTVVQNLNLNRQT